MAEIREGYKKTEIGIIPEDWEVKPLGHFVANINKKYEQNDKDIPYIGLEHLEVATGKLLGIGNTSQMKSSKNTFRKGDILFGKLRPYLRKYHYTEFEGACSTEILVLRPNKNCEFPYYLIQSNNFIDTVSNQSYGTKMPRTSWKQMRSFLFPIPPLKEQEKIAEILSTADNHIEDLDRLIEDYELLKKGMMQKLLTEGIGHTEFKDTEIGRIPNGWEVKALEEIANKKIKNSFIDGDWIEKEHLREDGIRLIQTGNIGIGEFVEKEDKKYISEESFRSLNCKEVFKDDILICRMAEPTGRSCIAPDLNKRMITSVDCVILRLDTKIHQLKFVNYFLNSYQGLKYSRLNEQGTTRRRITRKKLSKLPVPIPPLEEQEKIASILSSIDDHINQLKKNKDNYKILKQALMDRLLTGKIRVV